MVDAQILTLDRPVAEQTSVFSSRALEAAKVLVATEGRRNNTPSFIVETALETLQRADAVSQRLGFAYELAHVIGLAWWELASNGESAYYDPEDVQFLVDAKNHADVAGAIALELDIVTAPEVTASQMVQAFSVDEFRIFFAQFSQTEMPASADVSHLAAA